MNEEHIVYGNVRHVVYAQENKELFMSMHFLHTVLLPSSYRRAAPLPITTKPVIQPPGFYTARYRIF